MLIMPVNCAHNVSQHGERQENVWRKLKLFGINDNLWFLNKVFDIIVHFNRIKSTFDSFIQFSGTRDKLLGKIGLILSI